MFIYSRIFVPCINSFFVISKIFLYFQISVLGVLNELVFIRFTYLYKIRYKRKRLTFFLTNTKSVIEKLNCNKYLIECISTEVKY